MKCLLKLLFLFGLVVSSSGLALGASYKPEETECLARTLYYEARGEPISGIIGVAYTVINRVKLSSYPNTICGVVRETRDGACQYSYWCSHRFDIPGEDSGYKTSLAIARYVLNADNHVYDPTHGAIYYTEKGLKPEWAKHFRNYIIIGRHKFYFERKEYP